MLDNNDIQKLIEVLATKQDLNNLSVQLLSRDEFVLYKREMRSDLDGLREMVQALVASVDKLVGAVSGLDQEYAMVTSQIDRHEKWIQKLADKLGVKLDS